MTLHNLHEFQNITAVITAGGIGSRLLPYSKEIPKEMSPIITKDPESGEKIVVPMVQVIFEQLYQNGVRDFFFVVGRGKRAIEDHFTVDMPFLDDLVRKGKKSSADHLRRFYSRIDDSNLAFVIQTEPKGFGDAVRKTRPYVRGESFLVCAGDTYISTSDNGAHLSRLMNMHVKYRAEVTMLLQRDVLDPWNYGVVNGEKLEDDGTMRVKSAVEKPKSDFGRTVILPVYLFRQSIFAALEETHAGTGGEIQLTDAIEMMITGAGNMGSRIVIGVPLNETEKRIDIGTPQTLMEALSVLSV